MKPLVFYPPKAHEEAITDFLEALHVQFPEKQDVPPRDDLTGIEKDRDDTETSDTSTSERV